MSLEQSIAGFTSQAGLLLDLPDDISQAALAQMAAITANYNSILASQLVNAFVDKINGLDTNQGTQASPFKTIAKALSLTPRGGKCVVNLLSDYHMDTYIYLNGKKLFLQSSGTRKTITFAVFANVVATLRSINGFVLDPLDHISFTGVNIVWPDIPGPLSLRSTDSSAPIMAAAIGSFSVAFYDCQMTIPAAPAYQLIQSFGTFSLYVLSCTYPGAVTSPNGRWFDDVTNTAGTAANTLAKYLTNLTTL